MSRNNPRSGYKATSKQSSAREMLIHRFGSYCEQCGNGGKVELHHIVARGATTGNREARSVSEDVCLLVLLCKDCHDKAHNPGAQYRHLQIRIQKFGRERVRKVVDELNRVAGHILVQMPAPPDGDSDPDQALVWEPFQYDEGK